MRASSYARMTLCPCDLDLDPMTLIYEFDLDILKIYLQTNNELSRSRFSQVKARTRHTDRQTDRQTLPNALPVALHW